VGGSVICSPDGIGHVLNYASGSENLNGGAFDTTHLLLTRNADGGTFPVRKSSNLSTGQYALLNESISIHLYRFLFSPFDSIEVEDNQV